jgi:hypothetical protein
MNGGHYFSPSNHYHFVNFVRLQVQVLEQSLNGNNRPFQGGFDGLLKLTARECQCRFAERLTKSIDHGQRVGLSGYTSHTRRQAQAMGIYLFFLITPLLERIRPFNLQLFDPSRTGNAADAAIGKHFRFNCCFGLPASASHACKSKAGIGWSFTMDWTCSFPTICLNMAQ